jgi:hypothetical protein
MAVALRIAYALALAVWVGTLVFFSLGVTPVLFRTFGPAEGGRVVSALFPVYYGAGLACGSVAAAAATALWVRSRQSLWAGGAGVAALMLVLTGYAAFAVYPRAAALRARLQAVGAQAGPADRAAFDGVHRRAVQLNGAGVLLGVACVAGTAAAMRR